jgi:iron complex outermembrane receptor protein
MEWEPSVSGNISSTFGVNAFVQNIDNWVQWVPTGTYWSPRNIRNVRCQGFDASALIRFKMGHSKASLNGFYSYTESLDLGMETTDNRIQKQLPYIPLNQLLAKGSYEYGRWGIQLSYRYTGIRFTTDDHDPWLILPPVHLLDAGTSCLLKFKGLETLVTFRVNNILNYSYQLIRAYPAPGRSFLISVNVMFNQKKSDYAEI